MIDTSKLVRPHSNLDLAAISGSNSCGTCISIKDSFADNVIEKLLDYFKVEEYLIPPGTQEFLDITQLSIKDISTEDLIGKNIVYIRNGSPSEKNIFFRFKTNCSSYVTEVEFYVERLLGKLTVVCQREDFLGTQDEIKNLINRIV